MPRNKADKRSGTLFLFMGLVLAGCGTTASAPSPTLATVDQTAITEHDWHVAVGATNILEGVRLPTTKTAERAQLSELVQQTVVERWTLGHHVISFQTASQQAAEFLQHKVAPMLGGPTALSRALNAQQLTAEDFRRFVADQMVLQAAFNQVTAHNGTLAPSAAQTFYAANQGLFVSPASKLARQIVVSTKPQAISLEAQLKKGADFSSLARRDSKDSATAKLGGSMGWIKLGVSTNLPLPIISMINRLGTGQYGIVATHLGYSIIEVQAAKPGTAIPYSQVRPEIEAQLIQNAKSVAFQRWASGLERQAHVKLYQNG